MQHLIFHINVFREREHTLADTSKFPKEPLRIRLTLCNKKKKNENGVLYAVTVYSMPHTILNIYTVFTYLQDTQNLSTV